MAKIFAIVFALIAIQGCLARPKQDTPNIDKLTQDAKNALQDLEKKLEVDPKKVADTISQQSQAAATQIQSLVDKLKAEGEAHQGEVQTALDGAKAKFQELAEKFQKSLGDDVNKHAVEARNNFEANLEKAVSTFNDLNKKLEPQIKDSKDSLNKFMQESMNLITGFIKDSKDTFEKQIEEHNKTHKN